MRVRDALLFLVAVALAILVWRVVWLLVRIVLIALLALVIYWAIKRALRW